MSTHLLKAVARAAPAERHAICSLRWMSSEPLKETQRSNHTYTLPDLPYDYNALEPVISAEIMKLHHQKHHQTYITNFNKTLEQLESAHAAHDPQKVMALQPALRFNGGGHVNHSIFWHNLAPVEQGGGELPRGDLLAAIESQFQSVGKLVELMNTEGAAVQGSGWLWLGLDKKLKRLSVATTQNQDPLVSIGLEPLLGIDVWEHAYYLQYKNVRADYLKSIWRVVNWKDVASRYENAL